MNLNLQDNATSLRGESFPRDFRICHRADYELVMGSFDRKIVAPTMVLLARKNSLGKHRLGLVVSRKVGNAVIRNRVKRHLREIFRQRIAGFKCGVDLVVIARQRAADCEFQAIEMQFMKLFGRLVSEGSLNPAHREGPCIRV